MSEDKPRIGVVGVKHGKWLACRAKELEDKGRCTLAAICRRSKDSETHADFEPTSNLYAALAKVSTNAEQPHVFYDIEEMLKYASLDAVLIASPSQLHYSHALSALRHNCHIYIEKPLVWAAGQELDANRRFGNDLIDEAQDRGLVISGGSQLAAFFLPEGKYWNAASDVNQDSMSSLTLEIRTGRPKPPEHTFADLLPHLYGIAWAAAGPGNAKFVPMESGKTGIAPLMLKEDGTVVITQTYTRADKEDIRLRAVFNTTDGTRKLAFSVDGSEVTRKYIAEKNQHLLVQGHKVVSVEDPLKTSLRMFIDAIQGIGEPLHNSTALYGQHRMFCEAMAEWNKLEKAVLHKPRLNYRRRKLAK